MDIPRKIAEELEIAPDQVAAATRLIDSGATIPFIARYRKEATRGLDDTQLRKLHQRLQYLRELDSRRMHILKQIREQGKLLPELERRILDADSKTRLEDLYLPFKPRRRTLAQKATETGLAPLAEQLCNPCCNPPEEYAQEYINPELGIDGVDDALTGARHIIAERLAEDAAILEPVRNLLWSQGILTSSVVRKNKAEGARFQDYFDFREAIRTIPSHRALALFRGQKEKILRLKLQPGEDEDRIRARCLQIIGTDLPSGSTDSRHSSWLRETIAHAWDARIRPRMESDLESRLRERAESEAVEVFSRNLRDLLLAPPAGARVTMGLDPGLRTGVKVAIVDATGKLLTTDTIFPHAPRNHWKHALDRLAELAHKHRVELVSIGNGTGSRETARLAVELKQQHPQLKLTSVTVSEAGASVYSASELAASEMPDIDVSLRGAVSIARRLQDPLAELVKIEPESIGVGQYQHDVDRKNLATSLNAVVEDCVNAVGVDINTASASLLKEVSGLTSRVSQNIVSFREAHGRFRNREQIRSVPGFGDKSFELAAGFLRIANGTNPLDASAVHPESYAVVQTILDGCNLTVDKLIGNSALLRSLDPADYCVHGAGKLTVTAILSELEKPGRDPRPDFRNVEFNENISRVSDLKPGMQLQGVVTNVANFGAFVDIGVHQDGLVHISCLSDRFVRDPREIVTVGTAVKVWVSAIDAERGRISLSMIPPGTEKPGLEQRKPTNKRPAGNTRQAHKPADSAFASALSRALKK